MKQTFFLILTLMATVLNARTVMNVHDGSLREGNNAKEPTCEITKTPTGYEVCYTFDEIYLDESDIFTNCYICTIPEWGITHTEGYPCLPIHSDIYSIEDSHPFITITDSIYTDYSITLAPAVKEQLETSQSIPTEATVPAITNYTGYYPSCLAEVKSIANFRGTQNAFVQCNPIQYNQSTKKTRIFSRISFDITYPETAAQNEMQNSSNIVYNNVGFPSYTENAIDSLLADGDITKDYLILTTPELQQAATKFSIWKRHLGYRTYIESRSDWTSQTIKTFTYTFMSTHPSFDALLIIGSYEDIPAEVIPYTKTNPYQDHVTDLYYACFDGNDDIIPDVKYGRIPAETLSEALSAVEKSIRYEQHPPTNAAYYTHGAHIGVYQGSATNETRGYILASEKVRNKFIDNGYNIARIYTTAGTNDNPLYFQDNSPIPDELRKPTFMWNGTATDITNQLNSNNFYIFQRGHGSCDSWSYPYYNINNISQLNNSNQPIVFSISCLTGQFNNNCFAKNLLTCENGGCIAILAASEVSYTYDNNLFSEGLFLPLFSTITSKYPMGISLFDQYQSGTKHLMKNIANPSRLKYHQEIYHWFGDPTLKMYTHKPTPIKNVLVTHSNGELCVTLDNNTKGEISFYGGSNNSIYTVFDSSAKINTTNPENFVITISGDNKIPLIINEYKTSQDDQLPEFGIFAINLYGNELKILFSTQGATTIITKRLLITNLAGSILVNEDVSNSNGSFTTNISSWPSGTYIVYLGNVKDQDTMKFIKK